MGSNCEKIVHPIPKNLYTHLSKSAQSIGAIKYWAPVRQGTKEPPPPSKTVQRKSYSVFG